MKPPIFIHRAHAGWGDNLHQRAVMRLLMEEHEVWLASSCVFLYHDLIGQGLHVTLMQTALRTQRKNIERERHLFEDRANVPVGARRAELNYGPREVNAAGSVLGAMCAKLGVDAARADFRLPIPQAWHDKAQRWLDKWRPTKPLLIYRPLVERSEWGGNRPRNPDPDAYAQIFQRIRPDFFVVSVADLERGKEWTVGHPILADVALHNGELDFETMAALFARAALVYTAPGFPVILAQAVSTPQIAVFGGYEDSSSFSIGARWSPWCPIDVIRPCRCFSHNHACDKRIELDAAHAKVAAFVERVMAERMVAA